MTVKLEPKVLHTGWPNSGCRKSRTGTRTIRTTFQGPESGTATCPRDPPVLKILRRVNFGTGSRFGTDVAKRYGEGSEVLVFFRKKRQGNGRDTENYGGGKIVRIRAPYYF